MPITTEYKKGVVCIQLEGELDMNTVALFREKVDFALAAHGANKLLLNFAKVTFIDSSGLGVILGRYKKIIMLGGKIVVVKLPSQIERILDLSGLLKLIPVYATEEEALSSF